MRESSFVCCCLRMSTFWVNYSVSVTVSLLTFIAPIQLCCESVVGHHMHVCSLYFLDVFRDDYDFIQQYYIYPSSYQKTFHSIYFHTALLHMGCEKITTQHMLHHLHSPPPPPHSMELLPKALPEVTHRSSEHLETVLHLSAMTGKPTRGTSL